jgi:hypothetical protein
LKVQELFLPRLRPLRPIIRLEATPNQKKNDLMTEKWGTEKWTTSADISESAPPSSLPFLLDRDLSQLFFIDPFHP